MTFSVAAASQMSTVRFLERYDLIYPQEDSTLARRLIEKSKPLIIEAERFFEFRPVSIVSVYLTRSAPEFYEYARSSVPEWAQAVAIPSKNLIVIKYDSPEAINRLPQLLLHEMAHIYLERSGLSEEMPVWLHEGLAQWISHEELTLDERVLISAALYGNRLVSFAEMDSVLHKMPQQVTLIYALARSAIDYLEQNYGRQALKELLARLAENEPLEKAFLNVTGTELIDFEFGWYAWLEDKYRWMFLLSFNNLLWTGLVLLFLIAVWRVWARNRKTRKSWEDDPFEEM